MKNLNQNKFEIANLIGKRFITINDTEKFTGDLAVLKAITGGDAEPRYKYLNYGGDVRFQWQLVVSGNYPHVIFFILDVYQL